MAGHQDRFACRELTFEKVQQIDQTVAAWLGRFSFGRLMRLVRAEVLKYTNPDRGLPEHRVSISTDGPTGLVTAVMNPVDAQSLHRTIRALSGALLNAGSALDEPAREAKALGLLAFPDIAQELLASSHAPRDSAPRHVTMAHGIDSITETHDVTSITATNGHNRDDVIRASATSETAKCAESVPPRGVTAPGCVEAVHQQLPDDTPTPAAVPDTTIATVTTDVPSAVTGSDLLRLAGRQAVIHLHLAEGPADTFDIARVEGVGPVLATQVAHLIGEGAQVTVRPVIGLTTMTPTDAYETPRRTRQAVLARHLYEAFPYSNRSATGKHINLDHVAPYRHSRSDTTKPSAAQTGVHNLVPLARKTHRAKTAGYWESEMVRDGAIRWRSPAGLEYDIGPSGTTALNTIDTVNLHTGVPGLGGVGDVQYYIPPRQIHYRPAPPTLVRE